MCVMYHYLCKPVVVKPSLTSEVQAMLVTVDIEIRGGCATVRRGRKVKTIVLCAVTSALTYTLYFDGA